jgi:hypothetical protein
MEPNFLQRRFLGIWQFCVELKSNCASIAAVVAFPLPFAGNEYRPGKKHNQGMRQLGKYTQAR